jgi:hypothetical protein
MLSMEEASSPLGGKSGVRRSVRNEYQHSVNVLSYHKWSPREEKRQDTYEIFIS